MGDRTWFELTFKKEDEEKIARSFGDYNEKTGEIDANWKDIVDEYSICANFEEMNYGGEREVTRMAKDGLTFHGTHGEGGNYGRHEFVCFMGELVWMQTGHDGELIGDIRYDKETKEVTLTEESKKQIKKFHELYYLIQKYFSNCQEPEFIAEVAKRRLLKGAHGKN